MKKLQVDKSFLEVALNHWKIQTQKEKEEKEKPPVPSPRPLPPDPPAKDDTIVDPSQGEPAGPPPIVEPQPGNISFFFFFFLDCWPSCLSFTILAFLKGSLS